MIKAMLNNNNKINLTVGTINCFSDPIFFEYCKELSDETNSSLKFTVDFRYNDSIHWKLYLISPETVIVGSANLTTIGVSMRRDTAVCIKDEILYNSYIDLIQINNGNNGVLDCKDIKFNEFFNTYKKNHRISCRYSQKDDNNNQVTDYISWSSKDESSYLPVFIWENDFTKKDKEIFKNEISNQLIDNLAIRKSIYPVGWFHGTKSNKPYRDGEIILHMKNNGSHVRFYKVDFVIYWKNRWWLCSYRHNRKESDLFQITSDFKEAIRQKVPTWYENDKTYLNSKELRIIAENIKTTQQNVHRGQ